jgi:microcystin-dependent protein
MVNYTATGMSPQFFYNFPIWSPDGVLVYLNNELQPHTAYSVTGAGEPNGGTVIFNSIPPSGTIVSLVGYTTRERAVDYNQYVTLSAKAMNLDNDFQQAQIQENTTLITRALLSPPSDGAAGDPLVLPDRDARKDAYLAFDGDGDPIAVGEGANVVTGLRGTGSTPQAVMLWADDTGTQAADSQRIFGAPNGAATLNESGLVPDTQLPQRGHAISNSGMPTEYRNVLNFSDEFSVTDGDTSTDVATAIQIIDEGTGISMVDQYTGHGEIHAHTIAGGDNIAATMLPDGTIELFTDYVPKEYSYTFDSDAWDSDNTIVIPPEQHGLGSNDHLLVSVRDSAGNDVVCGINVADGGVVTLFADAIFPGMVMIYGGTAATVANMFNPMTHRGDMIYSAPISGPIGGRPKRLPIGQHNQVIAVSSGGIPEYKTLGEAAWMNINVPGGAVQLDNNGAIPTDLLPLNSMTYKGTFGSSTSSTGGDLPTEGMLDGDVYIADSDYSSTVAEKEFLTGQWAIFNGTSWDLIPFMGGGETATPVGSVLAHAGNTTPQGYLPCNGYTLAKADYPYLFTAIGTLYNSGEEDDDHFSIPNYNSEKRFLQGATSAGTRTPAGLPNITGTFGSVLDNPVYNHATGACYHYSQWNNTRWLSDDGWIIGLDASLSNAIYGSSDTVQPLAQNVVYIIKYK